MSEKIENKLRVVFDTQVFLRAGIKANSLAGRVIFDLSEYYQLLTSTRITAEIREVLNRPQLRAKFSALTDETVERILSHLALAEQIELTDIPAVSRDPKDDMFLECAKTGQADYLISEDKDLLVLNPYEGTQIVNVLAIYQRLLPPAE